MSLLAISLASFDPDPKSVYFWASVAGGVSQTATAAHFIVRAYRFAADASASVGWWGFSITVGSTSSSALLFITSVGVGGSLGLLVSALSVQLLFGLWVFMRFLTHRY